MPSFLIKKINPYDDIEEDLEEAIDRIARTANRNFDVVKRLLYGELDYVNLQDRGITGDKIQTGTIETQHIVAGGLDGSAITGLGDLAYEDAVEKSQLGTTIISGGYLVTGMVDASRIDTGTINANVIDVINLDASEITTGTLDASNINVTNLNGSNITSGTISANRIATNISQVNYRLNVGSGNDLGELQVNNVLTILQSTSNWTSIGVGGSGNNLFISSGGKTVIASQSGVEIEAPVWLEGDVDVDRDLDVGRNLYVDQDLYVDRDLDVDQDLDVDRHLYVGGNIETDGMVTADDGSYARWRYSSGVYMRHGSSAMDFFFGGSIEFKFQSNGNFTAEGTKSAVVPTKSYGKRKLYVTEAPDNRFITVIETEIKEGEQWIDLEPMFAETISNYLVLPFANGVIEVLETKDSQFKINVSELKTKKASFMIYGKRKNYEGIYMEPVEEDPEEVENRKLDLSKGGKDEVARAEREEYKNRKRIKRASKPDREYEPGSLRADSPEQGTTGESK